MCSELSCIHNDRGLWVTMTRNSVTERGADYYVQEFRDDFDWDHDVENKLC